MLESSAHFNIPKVHHWSHYVDHFRLFGSLVGYNRSITENCHMVLCKSPYRSSNMVWEYIQQILHTTSWREGFSIQRLNYDAWQSRRAQKGKQAKDHNGIDSPAGSNNDAPDRYCVRSSPAIVPTLFQIFRNHHPPILFSEVLSTCGEKIESNFCWSLAANTGYREGVSIRCGTSLPCWIRSEVCLKAWTAPRLPGSDDSLWSCTSR